MRLKNINNLPAPEHISEGDSIILSKGGSVVRVAMEKLRKYIGFSTGAELLGVPVPTAEDAGKVPTVNADGTGYELQHPVANLLWRNSRPIEAFAAKTIAHDNRKYNFFVVNFITAWSADANNFLYGVAIVAKNGEVHIMQQYARNLNGIDELHREVYANDEGFVFGSGKRTSFRRTSSSSSEEISGLYAIPTEIYGIS